MPPELWSIITNAGPVAGIMGWMWWTERKERLDYKVKYETLLAGLPDKLMAHAADRTKADAALIEGFKKLTRAAWAAIKKVEKPRRHLSTSEMTAMPSLPPAAGDDPDV